MKWNLFVYAWIKERMTEKKDRAKIVISRERSDVLWKSTFILAYHVLFLNTIDIIYFI